MMSVVFPDAAKRAHKNEKNVVLLFQNQIAHFGLIRFLKIELHHFFPLYLQKYSLCNGWLFLVVFVRSHFLPPFGSSK